MKPIDANLVDTLAGDLWKYFRSKGVRLHVGYHLRVHPHSLEGTFKAKRPYWDRVLKLEVERIVDEHGARLLPQIVHGLDARTFQFFTEPK